MPGFRRFKELGIQIRLAAREFAEGEIGLNIRKTELRVNGKKDLAHLHFSKSA
jgi:hypothetical protein